ncbi:MAG: peroxiredoxin family protein [candidate division Zixibacteria bacterium]|nr:peroxiredoxin family protein [candidate division Zixibacteria bacterium]MDH3939259.1 peroxiredoxin family protein [candidate division Zixibacteria bacterium]MDH4032732.1 peroxiredoxin family protein [candidate division Zixibacteria bacterium]
MASLDFKKIGVAVLIFAAVITVAVIVGVEAGNFYNERAAKQSRSDFTEYKLAQMQTLGVGGKLQDHTFENLEGADVRLSDLVTDRAIVLFFDVACGSCLVELEQMQTALADSLRRRIILISHDDRVDLQEARTAYNIDAHILWDQDNFYAHNLEINNRPFNVMIDSTLTIKKIVVGVMEGSEFSDFMSD